jgi:hypothetical protein
MPKAQIQNLVDQLESEINQLDSLETDKKQKLENLIQDIEKGLESDSLPDELRESLSESVAEFEVSHPRMTGIINDIMVTLSNLGI